MSVLSTSECNLFPPHAPTTLSFPITLYLPLPPYVHSLCPCFHPLPPPLTLSPSILPCHPLLTFCNPFPNHRYHLFTSCPSTVFPLSVSLIPFPTSSVHPQPPRSTPCAPLSYQHHQKHLPPLSSLCPLLPPLSSIFLPASAAKT